MMNVGLRQTPSFEGLSASSSASSWTKQMNRSSDTAHECVLRSILFRRGLRFRKNVRVLPGKADIVVHSIHKLLNSTLAHPEFFSRAPLRARKLIVASTFHRALMNDKS